MVEAFRSRNAVEATEPEKPGMLAGLADQQLAHALREIHADIARHWTVAAMAMTAGMSRSVCERIQHGVQSRRRRFTSTLCK